MSVLSVTDVKMPMSTITDAGTSAVPCSEGAVEPSTANTRSRPQRGAGLPVRYRKDSPDHGKRGDCKPYVLDREKALAQKEQALDRSYQPKVEMKEGRNLVITFQAVVYESFKHAFPRVQEKPGYSIKTPKSGNKQTLDGLMDSHALQVNIEDRKAYTINFYNTTSKINVNGQKLQTAFIEEDYPYVLDLISDLTPRQIYALSRELKDTIVKAKELPPSERKALEGSTHSQIPSKTTATESTGTTPTHTVPSIMPKVSASPDHSHNGPIENRGPIPNFQQ